MGHFPVRYDSRVVMYERKMFIRLATGSLSLYVTLLSINMNIAAENTDLLCKGKHH